LIKIPVTWYIRTDPTYCC